MTGSELSVPEVGGRRIDGTLADLERRARLCIGREQEKIAQDNALIAVLCDTVRLVREHCDYVTSRVQNVPVTRGVSPSRQAAGSASAFLPRRGMCGHQWHGDAWSRCPRCGDVVATLGDGRQTFDDNGNGNWVGPNNSITGGGTPYRECTGSVSDSGGRV